jgi:hypothetical protein
MTAVHMAKLAANTENAVQPGARLCRSFSGNGADVYDVDDGLFNWTSRSKLWPGSDLQQAGNNCGEKQRASYGVPPSRIMIGAPGLRQVLTGVAESNPRLPLRKEGARLSAPWQV